MNTKKFVLMSRDQKIKVLEENGFKYNEKTFCFERGCLEQISVFKYRWIPDSFSYPTSLLNIYPQEAFDNFIRNVNYLFEKHTLTKLN